MEYAVLQINEKQYIVEKDKEYKVDKLHSMEGEILTFDSVLLYVNGETVEIGKPFANLSINATVVKHARSPKVVGMVYKAKGHRRSYGHRQDYTVLKVTDFTHTT
ncbi:50S ribosomal protein L21 [candidate division WWE3 bacterium CG_4_9_14_3_um_filter_41_6]|uniref:Large ribosomal subunit protein bL21 n=1 Tax=candidate division WWE3 bacterium CG_4_10_14_0_2_um_filter_41_14 TaxID=1975072 RepID=A0A2M7TGN1_UNCKA|nr:MAG: 50S ribosomal protein L21 [candidate division WWE3 bacterium CG_4_10_14_0_2_um_filter_41_14]PJA39682.1 MAG: 50S ribosomal protein L21 [candidate division WWE3 bacterium CG_4_9_14_3_um_filter_41_6]